MKFWKIAGAGVNVSGPTGARGIFLGCAGCGGRVIWWCGLDGVA